MSVDVYLIAQLEWKHGPVGSWVGPTDRFKIGFSLNPFERLEQLKSGSASNLAIFGVILCADESAARMTEKKCHDLLGCFRARGEWFNHSIQASWDILQRAYPVSSLWLTNGYFVDLDSMRLVAPEVGTWCGMAENYHAYAAYKQQGVLIGPFAHLGKAA